MKTFQALRRRIRIACAIGAALMAAEATAQTFSDQGALILGGANYDSRSASLADYDGDGDLDLFFQGGGSSQRLLHNNLIESESLSFSDVSSNLPAGLGPSWSAAWADYDGDGNVDVFVGQSNIGGSGDVLRNSGTGTFTNESVAVGLNDPGFHQNVGWNDIDMDRDLDLILAMEGPLATDEKHEIYLQGPGGSFSPVGASVGFQQPVGVKAYGMAIGDTDGDGDLDIYISTCRGDNNIRNNFYENQLVETGTLSFIDIADTNGTQFMTNSYGAEFLDFDDDSDLDLFMVGADGESSKIFRNDGGNLFTDVDTVTGHPLLTDTGGDLNGGRAVDYDNDGDLDLFFHDHRPGNGKNVARKLYRNDGNWQFTDVTVVEGLHAASEGSYDSAWGDIDLDGDQDLIATTDSNFDERVFISSASTSGNHWMYIKLSGLTENTTAVGASVYATINAGTPQERTLRRESNTNVGTFNQSDLPVHFGLGSADHIDLLRVVWPDGTEQLIENLVADQYLTITVPGDFDGDHDIDADDLAQWESDYGVNGDSDSFLDGTSDGIDFLAWQRQFGKGGAPLLAPQVVPEPTSAWLLLIASAVTCRPRWGRVW